MKAALTLEDQHELNSSESEKDSEENSSVVNKGFYKGALSTSSETLHLNSDSSNKVNATLDGKQPKLPRRSTRRCVSLNDSYAIQEFLSSSSQPLNINDPDYCPPKTVLNELQKSTSEAVPKSDIRDNVKERKLRRSKRHIHPCNYCDGYNKSTLYMSYKKAQPLLCSGMNNEPISTEELRDILEDESKAKDINKHVKSVTQGVVNHDSDAKEDINENKKPKMTRTRSSLKLNPKKKNVSKSIQSNNNESSNLNVSKESVQKSKPPAKKRKRQNCRKQFRHEDITLYKLGAGESHLCM